MCKYVPTLICPLFQVDAVIAKKKIGKQLLIQLPTTCFRDAVSWNEHMLSSTASVAATFKLDL